MNHVNTKRQRLLDALNFEDTDRVPLLGGWIIADSHQQAIAGCTEQAYWQDPVRWAIEAHRVLDVDGMIMVVVPDEPGEYLFDTHVLNKQNLESLKERFARPEDVLAHARSLPSPREAARRFDVEAWKEDFRREVLAMQQRMGDMVYLPTLWDIVHPTFEWFWEFGYENYLMFMQLYPEAAGEFFGVDAAVTRLRAEVVAQLYQELDLVPLTLVGTDICGGGGPLISPKFLREFYFPHVRRSLEPLCDIGVRMVWHSDGDIRPLVDDILSCGVSGFQGFQEEYGVDIADVARHRTLDGERLTLFAGPSVTTTLPRGTVEDVHREIERIIDTLVDECALFVLPANNILPDCPMENVVAMHRHTVEYGRQIREIRRTKDKSQRGNARMEVPMS
jgi:hypothetical protein